MKKLAFMGLVILGAIPHLLADGKFFVREDVRPGEPFQRALIVHDQGREFLLVQPQLVGAAKEFAWVLPVPAPPALGHLDPGAAMVLFYLLDKHARPDVVRVKYLVFLGLSIGILVLTAFSKLSRGKKRAIYLGLVFVWLVGFLFIPTVMMTRGLPQGSEVEILDAKRVGIYETTTVRSANPGAMKEWLDQGGYRVGPEELAAIKSYVERGWCFVAMKIVAEEACVHDGLLQALALDFPSADPVYPFALTATGGTETRVVLYVYTSHRMDHPAFQTAYAGLDPGTSAGAAWAWERYWDREYGIQWGTSEGKPPPAPPPNPGFMTKLRGTLSSRNVQGDVVLRPAADDAMLRERAWLW